MSSMPRNGRKRPEFPAKFNGLTPSYFEVTGTRLEAGRTFTDADTSASPKVAIINDTMARTLFPGQCDRRADRRRGRAAGVDGGRRCGRRRPLHRCRAGTGELPALQALGSGSPPRLRGRGTDRWRRRGIGHSGDRGSDRRLDPDLTVRGLMPVTARMEEVTSQMPLMQPPLLAFAVLGLLLASLGIYGAMARMVAHRTSESACAWRSAPRSRRRRPGLPLGGRIVAIGAGAGLLGAFGLSRLLASVLPMLETDSSLVGAAGAVLLTAVALAACYFPARRATRVNPGRRASGGIACPALSAGVS